jgi:hypothetical protein
VDKLHKHTDAKTVSLNRNVQNVCGNLGEKLTDHTAGTDQRLIRVTEEMNARNRILAIDLTQNIKETENNIQAVKARGDTSQRSDEQRYT